MLIAMEHINNEFFNSLLPNLEVPMKSFRMPMFFFLSGLVFKTYGSFNEFLRKKINGLIISLLFFHFICSALRLPLVTAVHYINPNVDLRFTLIDIMPPIFDRFWRSAGALWFLAALFNVNILFYFFKRYFSRAGIIVATFICSMLGWVLMRKGIMLPFEFDISLVSLPYFMLGYAIKNFNLVSPSKYDKWGILIIIPSWIFLYFFSNDINLLYQVVPDYLSLYSIPFIAILSLFWFSKNLGKVPLVCYYGRYSLIVLGTHQVIISYLGCLFAGIGLHSDILQYVLVMLAELLVIPLMIKYFPRFTAQKDFFKPGWNL